VAIRMSGEFEARKPPQEVYDFLTDADKFAPLLPDYQGHSKQADGSFLVKVRVGISYIRGTAEVRLRLAEAARPQRALYAGSGKAPGGSVELKAGFDLAPGEGGGTRVAWQGEAEVHGGLASMAGGMLEPLGKKNVQKLIDGLQQALS
jgi:carbon monoxide dehydrogenase subunit G